jgi:hypothetical protein
MFDVVSLHHGHYDTTHTSRATLVHLDSCDISKPMKTPVQMTLCLW